MTVGLPFPSIAQGYARDRTDNCAFPNWWDNLVGSWVPALGPTGLTLFDVTRFRNDGALTNMLPASDWVVSDNPRMPGYALDYDASDDEVQAGAAIDVTEPLTLLAWVRPRTITGARSIVYLGEASNEHGLTIVSSEFWALTQSGSNFQAQTSGPIVDTWFQVVGVFAGDASRKIYYNGRFRNEDTTSVGISSSTPAVRIGNRFSTNQYYDGEIGEISIYNVALTDDDIAFLYDMPAPHLRRQRPRSRRALVAVAGWGPLLGGQRNRLVRSF